MKKEFFRWSVLLLVLSNVVFLYAQVSDEKRMRDEEKLREDTQRANEKKQLGNNTRINKPVDIQSAKAPVKRSDVRVLTPAEEKEIKRLTSPDSEDLAKYSEILKQKKTGIFKLLNTDNCGDTNIFDANKGDCFFRLPVFSRYSFRHKDFIYSNLTLSDINYQKQQLLVGLDELNIGIIGAIGDVSLESLNKNTLEVSQLQKISLPKKRDQIEIKRKEINQGIYINGKKFADYFTIQSNQTYLLRTYTYRTNTDGTQRDASSGNNEADIIIAFRVIRKDANNDLTIVWKQLYKGDTRQV